MLSENRFLFLFINVFLFIKTDCFSIFTFYSNVYMVYPGYIPEEKVNQNKVFYPGIGLPVFLFQQVYSERSALTLGDPTYPL